MYIFDIETDGLASTKIHVLSYSIPGSDLVHSIYDYDAMRDFLYHAGTLIGHNIIGFDIPELERILNISLSHLKLIDTLAVSWYLYPERTKHGLETWGDTFNVVKPVIKDWENLSIEEYTHRCEEDVKINKRLWVKARADLMRIYQSEEEMLRLLDYLSFKMTCAKDQEKLRWKLDVVKAQELNDQWSEEINNKKQALADAMPKVPIIKEYKKPKVMYRKDGSLSALGQQWCSLLEQNRLPQETQSFNLTIGYEDGNPSSTHQIKDWLHSLGWKPRTFKFVRNKDGQERSIEQVRKNGQLCDSVTDMIEDFPFLGLLEGYTVLQHRLAIIKSFLKNHRDGYLVASIGGLTNTLRFKHRDPLVNLPGVSAAYGADIRGCLTCPEGYTLCGSDMVSLEDTTKRHYMYDHDPEYVKEMCKPGFDPHLDLAKHNGAVTQEDIDAYNSGNKPELKAVRKNYKVTNYSATYGVGASKLSRELGVNVKQAKSLLDGFWRRNWAINSVAKSLQVRTLGDKMWLKNPVSGFWYSLRSDKDRFSTLNQGTGVYCFDTWVRHCKESGVQVIGQFHDEIIALIPEGSEGQTEDTLKTAISDTNSVVNLNIPLEVDVQFGKTYADIH